ncbi:MAG TPA: polysaccharide pyruvyl transferase family protein [Spirochaetota bacterium]|nr:polysaccharide pyruvyl transferase family protein [Spirochaetota bacterium]HOS32340.1 polysaccharide pyruvyl transferase family protein [Spirochaetota bacterium]HOS54437.1 polysaccharide pyruvyl transferase family protein [Spirochaetota bacterium]HQF76930.1 polysaccharide pyruvyl transferase family protein [Spirochaetota bacterium]HQH30155.1 polysaccharide pyruvyl transferase family protein [Spirochaetota bacterium]
MKSKIIRIITFHNVMNCGAVLQLYALITFLKKKYVDVGAINYVNKKKSWIYLGFDMLFSNNKKSNLDGSKLTNYHIKDNVVKFIKKKIIQKPYFKNFTKKLIKTKKYSSDYSIQKRPPRADFYISGSDQVWNSSIIDINNETAYFLNFGSDKTKRIGYAISMGGNNFNLEYLDKIKTLINNFDSLSARELFTQEQMLKYNNKKNEIPIVLDPTLLLKSEEYDILLKKKKIIRERYFLSYIIIDRSKLDIVKAAKDYLKIKWIDLSNYDYSLFDKKELKGPINFLYRIKYAEYVVTNSFHGTVFSILYKKQFFTIPYTNEFASRNARFLELLESLELSDRVVYSYDELNRKISSNQKINYDLVFEKLKILKQKSIDFLLNSLDMKDE